MHIFRKAFIRHSIFLALFFLIQQSAGHQLRLNPPYQALFRSPHPQVEIARIRPIPISISGDANIAQQGSKDPVGECLTRKGSPGRCTRLGECYGVFDSPSTGGIVPQFASSNDPQQPITFQESTNNRPGPALLRETLTEEIYNTSQTIICSSPVAYQSKFMGAFPNQGGLICCPFDRIIGLEAKGIRGLTPDPDASQSKPSLKGDTRRNDESSSCGIPTLILKARVSRAERVVQAGMLKITGGVPATRGEFPWMVAIFGVNKKFTCGGSLINNNYVLTAGHCLSTYNSQDVSKMRVTIGDYNIQTTDDGPHETRKIQKILLHNGFNLKNFTDDIALLKLDRPVTFTDYIQPICLPPTFTLMSNSTFTHGSRGDLTLAGRKVVVIGWGRERSHGSPSPILRKVEVPIWSLSECQRIYKIFVPGMKVMDTNVCAGDGKKNKDSCIGDSGGPLMSSVNSKWTQLGIVSWGKGCGSFPGVYTRIDKYLPWIMKNIV